MKKLLLFLLPLLALGSCKPIDPVRTVEEYKNVFVYSYDTQTNTGYASDFASIEVKNDMTSGYFMLGLNDFKLAENLPVRSSTVSGLVQYLDEEFGENGEVTGYNYTFFSTQGQAYYSGDLSVFDLRFGWLSTVYWGSFMSDGGRYRLWVLPRETQMYANRNTIVNSRGDSIRENAIHPRYDLEFNVAAGTVNLRGEGVMLTYSESEHKFFDIRQLTFPNVPVDFNASGFTARVNKMNPVVNGSRDEYELTDLELRFNTDFDGQRVAEYTLRRLSDNETVKVISYFDYFRKS